jgi:hypothetical protein
MNSNIVLKKIMTLLSMDEKEMKLTYARLTDGTIVESPTFDVGEPVEVVSEDGTKSPAPDGMHDLALKDTEGNETYIKVRTEGGKIVERENVEMEMVDVKEIPQADQKDKVNVVPTAEGSVTSGTTKMAEEIEPTESDDETTEEVEPIPADEDKVDLAKAYEKLTYRIEELEKKIQAMEEVKEESDIEAEDVDEDDELPKLDGAPVENVGGNTKLSAVKRTADKVQDTQSRFLSKLYK